MLGESEMETVAVRQRAFSCVPKEGVNLMVRVA